MQIKIESSAIAVGSSPQHVKPGSKSSRFLDLQSFCQLQVEQLTARHPIFFARIVYYEPLLEAHQEVTNYAPPKLDQDTLAYLKSEKWLVDFPPAFTLNELILDCFTSNCYICPLGYRNQKTEYILILAHEPLSPNLQQYVKQTAMLLSKYVDIYLDCGRQQGEIQLLEQIVQRVGHQLRNPLALIGLYAENLCLGLPSGSWQEQATIIRETTQYLDTNLTELIYCSHGTNLRVTLQDLRNLVVESIQGLQPWINQKQIKISYPETSTTLAIARLQIKQVFDNLLSNAVHFSPHSGTITCSWQIFQCEVLIQISDQGPGISPEDLQQIFTPFYSRRPGGTGLGLTIAKKIVLDHQGSLWAQSLLEGGAQFSLTLPRSMTF